MEMYQSTLQYEPGNMNYYNLLHKTLSLSFPQLMLFAVLYNSKYICHFFDSICMHLKTSGYF